MLICCLVFVSSAACRALLEFVRQLACCTSSLSMHNQMLARARSAKASARPLAAVISSRDRPPSTAKPFAECEARVPAGMCCVANGLPPRQQRRCNLPCSKCERSDATSGIDLLPRQSASVICLLSRQPADVQCWCAHGVATMQMHQLRWHQSSVRMHNKLAAPRNQHIYNRLGVLFVPTFGLDATT